MSPEKSPDSVLLHKRSNESENPEDKTFWIALNDTEWSDIKSFIYFHF